jgi:hypothetical protein
VAIQFEVVSGAAERGFVALSFDHRYYGERAGRPRQLENPTAKIADIHAAAASLNGDRRFANPSMFAVGICAGGGYMARAVAAEPLFCAFVGVAGYYAQATEQSINTAAPAIARAREAEKRWRETGVEETVPAVAADNGDVAMPLAEAFAYYGTPSGGVPNYVNGFAVALPKDEVTANVGNTAEAMAKDGMKKIGASYEFAIHTHGSIGPS